MRVVFLVLGCLFCAIHISADAAASSSQKKLNSRIASLAEIVPALRPPIILNPSYANSDTDIAAITAILQKEPTSANPVTPNDHDEEPEHKDEEEHGEGEHEGGGGEHEGGEHEGGEGGEHEGGESGGHSKKHRKHGKKGDDDDDEKTKEVNAEIKMLEKLIAQGKKIETALPDKEKRLDELKQKLASAQHENEKEAASAKLDQQNALLKELNKKITKLTKKLDELQETRKQLQAEITKNQALVNGAGGEHAVPVDGHAAPAADGHAAPAADDHGAAPAPAAADGHAAAPAADGHAAAAPDSHSYY